MHQPEHHLIKAKYRGWCCGCRRDYEPGDEIVIAQGLHYCKLCASDPKISTTSKHGFCSKCRNRIRKGEQIGWAPLIGTWCYYCLNGKDSNLFLLPADERQKVQKLLDKVGRLRLLSPRSDDADNELQSALEELRDRYAHIIAVRKILEAENMLPVSKFSKTKLSAELRVGRFDENAHGDDNSEKDLRSQVGHQDERDDPDENIQAKPSLFSQDIDETPAPREVLLNLEPLPAVNAGCSDTLIGDTMAIPEAPLDHSRVIDTTPPEEGSRLSVGQLTELLNGTMRTKFADVTIIGEITGFPRAGKHWYFNLKDDRAVLKVVCFAKVQETLQFKPYDGLQVAARGRIEIYAPSGQYQLTVKTLVPLGEGAFQIAYDQLKAKLLGEGLLDEAIKKPLPKYPRRIGIITSRAGAVLSDMRRVLDPSKVSWVFCDVRVQGVNADDSITRALDALQSQSDLDAIIIARGGGSKEELMCFNSEKLARAIRQSRVPVISAVGHETDWTICDLASDKRASTPTAAAELISKSRDEMRRAHEQLLTRLIAGAQKKVDAQEARLRKIDLIVRLDSFDDELDAAHQHISHLKSLLMARTEAHLMINHQVVQEFKQQLVQHVRSTLNTTELRLANANPKAAIARVTERLNGLSKHIAQVRHSLIETIGRSIELQDQRRAKNSVELLQRMNDLTSHLSRRLENASPSKRLPKFEEQLAKTEMQYLHVRSRLDFSMLARINQCDSRLHNAREKLRTLGPESVLARGFAIVQDLSTGDVVVDASKLKSGQELTARFSHGTAILVVKEVAGKGENDER